METQKKKIKVNDSTLGDMIEYLRRETEERPHGRVGLNAVRSTAVNMFRVAYGDSWHSVAVSSISPNEVLSLFLKNSEHDYGEHTLDSYRMRLRRAFDIYNGADMKKEQIRRETKMQEARMIELINEMVAARKTYANFVSQCIFTSEARKKYDTYMVSVGGKDPIAIGLPKRLSNEDRSFVKSAISRACAFIRVRRGGEM